MLSFIVSTETFIFFRSDSLTHDSLTHLTHFKYFTLVSVTYVTGKQTRRVNQRLAYH